MMLRRAGGVKERKKSHTRGSGCPWLGERSLTAVPWPACGTPASSSANEASSVLRDDGVVAPSENRGEEPGVALPASDTARWRAAIDE